MKRTNRPDVEALLGPLKGFQRRTVDHVFKKLYLDPDPSFRFLVADEVGLGKTLVARGVVARVVDHLWETVGRIDVVYICSNGAIARQNIRKLAVGSSRELSLATRLTMLPRHLKGLSDQKLNFVSFTPGTSFDMGHKGGWSQERVVLYWLIKATLAKSAGLKRVLQVNVGDENWRKLVARKNKPELDPSLSQAFARDLMASQQEDLREELAEVMHVFKSRRWSDANHRRRNKLVGELRLLLARTCVQALEPDLVIMDEFQRFKHLLKGGTPMSDLARYLCGYVTPEGNRARVLLLSATPYKMYSTDREVGEDDHYPDFIATTRFLMDDDAERVRQFEQKLGDYRVALHRAFHGDIAGISDKRDEVQAELSQVMVRTERVKATSDRQAMVTDHCCQAAVEESDLAQFMLADGIAQAVEDRDPVEYWKSAPYLINFMGDYKLKTRFLDRLANPEVVEAVLKNSSAMLQPATINKYRELDPGNARLRMLMGDLLGDGQWQLLWIPPSFPYWPAAPPFSEVSAFTKALIFSAWNVVPDVVSAAISYEAERRMLANTQLTYHQLHKQRRGLLRYARSEGRLTGMNVLCLQYPCLALADEISPLAERVNGVEDVRQAARQKIERLLRRLPPGSGPSDERWYWAALALMDAQRGVPESFLEEWSLTRPSYSDIEIPDEDEEDGSRSRFADHTKEFLRAFRGETTLGSRPNDLVEVLTEIALGAPGTLAARTFRALKINQSVRQSAAGQVAEGFRSLFNQPTAMALLGQIFPKIPYWQKVLRYTFAGNLQAVLDEYFHQLWEQGGWERVSMGEAALKVANNMAFAATIKTSRVSADIFRVKGGRVRRKKLRIRTSYALRYGRLVGDEQRTMARESAVRVAFNSPFHPFVLASTSIGQEGLDFHPWCHAIYHWNLPGNPVDLEQREGRVHRYKGHAIRKNAATLYGEEAISARWSPGKDPWSCIFAEACERTNGGGVVDLEPFWICNGPNRVERRIPMLPYSKEIEQLARLKKDLVAYRLVFGQPRQQELLELLERQGVQVEELDGWTLDLQPAAEGQP